MNFQELLKHAPKLIAIMTPERMLLLMGLFKEIVQAAQAMQGDDLKIKEKELTDLGQGLYKLIDSVFKLDDFVDRLFLDQIIPAFAHWVVQNV